jgi:hypothetical protein
VVVVVVVLLGVPVLKVVVVVVVFAPAWDWPFQPLGVMAAEITLLP